MQIAFIESDVINTPRTNNISEAAVGSGDVVHHFLQYLLVAIKTIAPSQASVGFVPVDGKDDFVLALTDPLEDLRRINHGFLAQRIHGNHFLFKDIDVILGVNQGAAIGVTPFDIVAIHESLFIEGVP